LKQTIFYTALALALGAAIFLAASDPRARRDSAPPGFVRAAGTRFVLDGRPFRFVGANAAVMYRDEDRALMPHTLGVASRLGIRVLRVWAHGEGRPEDGVMSVGRDREDWPRTHPFRRVPNEWNEEAFVHLDRVLAEAARQNLRVQLCLTNWWRDTGGVTQYLRWAGVGDAADDAAPFGINVERAMEFYTNEETRRLYREHVERVVGRRNTVTGRLYRDDPTIFAYELMNEAQAPTGRWGERRRWVEEMSAYVKSLDPHHLVTSGSWGYRSVIERRAWLEEQRLPTLDFADVHNYPRDDHDSFVLTPAALGEFLENRAAAAFSVNKPLVLGEFGMGPEGYNDSTQADWFRALYEHQTRTGTAGTFFWIITPDPRRGYGLTYTNGRDEAALAEIARGAQILAAHQSDEPPPQLLRAGRHLVPRQFAFSRAPEDPLALPKVFELKRGGDARNANDLKDAGGPADALGTGASVGGTAAGEGVQAGGDGKGKAGGSDRPGLLYRFAPESAMRGRFEKMGGGEGYVWGSGVGFFEYVVPARARRRVGEIVVRAHLQPVLPNDTRGRFRETRVTLYVNGTNCGSRVARVEPPPGAFIGEWRVASWLPRLAAARGLPLTIRLAVDVGADLPLGLNVSNFPEGYPSDEAKPVEVELR
jgi:mannan endo-1,4-beta-mannosidase